MNIIYFFLLSEGIKKIKIFLESGTEEFERVYIKKLDLFIISENFCFERIEKNFKLFVKLTRISVFRECEKI